MDRIFFRQLWTLTESNRLTLRLPLAPRLDREGESEVGRAEPGIDFHRAVGVGPAFGGLSLARKGLGDAVTVAGNQLLPVDGLGQA